MNTGPKTTIESGEIFSAVERWTGDIVSLPIEDLVLLQDLYHGDNAQFIRFYPRKRLHKERDPNLVSCKTIHKPIQIPPAVLGKSLRDRDRRAVEVRFVVPADAKVRRIDMEEFSLQHGRNNDLVEQLSRGHTPQWYQEKGPSNHR